MQQIHDAAILTDARTICAWYLWLVNQHTTTIQNLEHS
jgi:hypothetical protein